MTPEDKENLDRAFERYPAELYAERERQIKKWGSDQVKRKGVWFQFTVIGEEFGEVARALLEWDIPNLRIELFQVAACCLALVQYFNEQKDAENKHRAELRYRPEVRKQS